MAFLFFTEKREEGDADQIEKIGYPENRSKGEQPSPWEGFRLPPLSCEATGLGFAPELVYIASPLLCQIPPADRCRHIFKYMAAKIKPFKEYEQ